MEKVDEAELRSLVEGLQSDDPICRRFLKLVPAVSLLCDTFFPFLQDMWIKMEGIRVLLLLASFLGLVLTLQGTGESTGCQERGDLGF